MAREIVEPTLIENTITEKYIDVDGVHRAYYITPNEGYVLHDKRMDEPVIDRETGEETGEIILIYRTSTASCPASYDFAVNPWEFYTVPADSVPADNIHGGVNNNHETI